MATRFVNLDRDTPMLLPPDLHEWVAKDDLVRFIIDAVEATDFSSAKVNQRGTGSEQYPPSMMLALLIYCYANRIFSSRQIEKATYSHVSVRFLCANEHPDHDTIATFRAQNYDLVQNCFVAVLCLARQLKAFGKLGTVSVDGTKLGARASREANRNGKELEQEIATLQTEIKGLLKQAEQADAEDTSSETSLAAELQDPKARRAALQAAKAQLEERKRASHAQRSQNAKGVDPDEPSPPSCPPRGTPKKSGAEPIANRDANQTINLVDAESRLMRDSHGAFLQGYNAQIVVEAGEESRSQIILSARLTNDCNDRRALEENLERVPENLRKEITHVVADTGYDNADLIDAVEKKWGLTVLCPPQNPERSTPPKYRLKRVNQKRQKLNQAMRERLQQPEAKAIYRRRSPSVEPVFGVLKNVLGFRRFHLFGLAKSQIELTLLALAYNLRRLAQMPARKAA